MLGSPEHLWVRVGWTWTRTDALGNTTAGEGYRKGNNLWNHRLWHGSGGRVVPHVWKTGISIAAAVHLAAVTPHCPFVEFLPVDLSSSSLRRELTSGEPELVDGRIPLPDEPGLGIEIDGEALHRFEQAAVAVRV